MSRSRSRKSVARRVQKHRQSLRAAGLRPIQIWVPDVRSKSFAIQARRQSLAIANSAQEQDDLAFIVNAVDSPANGITLCSGSLGAGPKNDVSAIARRFADKIFFAHLRNVAKEPDGSFMEADHLGGDTDMVAVVTALLEEQKRRKDSGDPRWRIPMRPDHGHELLDDVGKRTHPGYPAIAFT